MKRLPEEDLQHILLHTRGLWDALRNKSIFITGGTGFFGKWLTESFLFCNRELQLNSKAIILSRTPEKFRAEYPEPGHEGSLIFIKGDIGSFQFPALPVEMIIHAAVDYRESLELFDSHLEGSRRILEFAVHSGAKRLLFTSSGAVYGKQPPGLSHIPEEYPGSPDPLLPGSAYGLAKKVTEFYGAEFSRRNHFDFLIARCFAFAGPHLPLDKGAAIGNFIRDGLEGKTITIQGDGTPYRSYMYASDLMIWLWTILFTGKANYPYNVGSDEEVSISELAIEVAEVIDSSLEVVISRKKDESQLPERYVPSTNRARQELSLEIRVKRNEAIAKMVNWYK